VRKLNLPKKEGGMGEFSPQHVNSHYGALPPSHNHYVFLDGNYGAPLEKLITAAELEPGVLGQGYKKRKLVKADAERVGDAIRARFGLPLQHS
jgi:hypothetical protein